MNIHENQFSHPIDLIPPNAKIPSLYTDTSALVLEPDGQAAVVPIQVSASRSPQAATWNVEFGESQTQLIISPATSASATAITPGTSSSVVSNASSNTPSSSVLTSSSAPSSSLPVSSIVRSATSDASSTTAAVSTSSQVPSTSSQSSRLSSASSSASASTSSTVSLTVTTVMTTTSIPSSTTILISSAASHGSSAYPFLASTSDNHNPSFIVGIVLGTLVALSVLTAVVTWVIRTRRIRSTRSEAMSELGYGNYNMFSPRPDRNLRRSDSTESEEKPPYQNHVPPSGYQSSVPNCPYPSVSIPPLALGGEANLGSLHIANLMPGDISSSETVNRAGIGAGFDQAKNSFKPTANVDERFPFPERSVQQSIERPLLSPWEALHPHKTRRQSIRLTSAPAPVTPWEPIFSAKPQPPVPALLPSPTSRTRQGSVDKGSDDGWASSLRANLCNAITAVKYSFSGTNPLPIPPLTDFPQRRATMKSVMSRIAPSHKSTSATVSSVKSEKSYGPLEDGKSIRFDDGSRHEGPLPPLPTDSTVEATYAPDITTSNVKLISAEVNNQRAEANPATPSRSSSVWSSSTWTSNPISSRLPVRKAGVSSVSQARRPGIPRRCTSDSESSAAWDGLSGLRAEMEAFMPARKSASSSKINQGAQPPVKGTGKPKKSMDGVDRSVVRDVGVSGRSFLKAKGGNK